MNKKSIYAAVAFILAVIICGCSPAERRQKAATWNYWQQLGDLSMVGSAIQNVEKAKDRESTILAFKELSTRLRRASEKIAEISVIDVDPDLINYSAKCVELYNESAKWADDMLSANSANQGTLMTSYSAIQQKTMKLASEELILRSALSKRYNRDFPKL